MLGVLRLVRPLVRGEAAIGLLLLTAYLFPATYGFGMFPDPEPDWGKQLEDARWTIENADFREARAELEHFLNNRGEYWRQIRRRHEASGYGVGDDWIQTSMDMKEDRLRTEASFNRSMLKGGCEDFREAARELAEDAPGSPKPAPRACDNPHLY